MPANLLPLHSGVGNIANAVPFGLEEGPFEDLTSYTEVIRDGMVRLLESAKVTSASATAFSLRPEMLNGVNADMANYRERIVRPQEISNHPEIISRLGVIAMNGLIEPTSMAKVNSTHVIGSRTQNGIGGSGDFARNGYLSIFMARGTGRNRWSSRTLPPLAQKGAAACGFQPADRFPRNSHARGGVLSHRRWLPMTARHGDCAGIADRCSRGSYGSSPRSAGRRSRSRDDPFCLGRQWADGSRGSSHLSGRASSSRIREPQNTESGRGIQRIFRWPARTFEAPASEECSLSCGLRMATGTL